MKSFEVCRLCPESHGLDLLSLPFALIDLNSKQAPVTHVSCPAGFCGAKYMRSVYQKAWMASPKA